MQTFCSLSLTLVVGLFPLNPSAPADSTSVQSPEPSTATLMLVGVGLGIAAISAAVISQDDSRSKSLTESPQSPLKPMPLLMPAKQRIDTWEDDSPVPHQRFIESPGEPFSNSVSESSDQIITQLASTSYSIVFSSPPGCGKTTTELAWLAKLFELYPQALVFIAGQKNDSWLGLSQIPTLAVVLDGVSFQPLVNQVNRVFSVLTQRKNLPPSERHSYQHQPCWLLLADWYATSNTLMNAPDRATKAIWADIQAKIASIITIGREFLVGVCADTHSFNTKALGISDGNIRDCLNICALGKVTRNSDGQEQGGFGAIAKAIANKLVLDDDGLRSQLIKDLDEYQRLSEKRDRPVLFTTMGHPPRLLLLPDLRSYETYQLPDEVIQHLAQAVLSSELPDEPPDDLPNGLALHLQEILKLAQRKGTLTARDVQLANVEAIKSLGLNADAIRYCFEQLASEGYGETAGEGNRLTFTPVEC